MNVLIFHQYYVTPEQAGSTRTYHFISKLLERGHRVTLVTGCQVRIEKDERQVIEYQPESNFTIISVRDGYSQKLGFWGRLSAFLKYGIFSCSPFKSLLKCST